MNGEVHEFTSDDGSWMEAKQELDRLLADRRFRATERQRRILVYLANCRFSGCDEGVKAYAIGLDVLGRTSDFDPSVDPIVRIEMGRLRSSLESYYAAFRSPSSLIIRIPKGNYLASFCLAPSAVVEAPQNGSGELSVPFAVALSYDAQKFTGNSVWSWIGASMALTLALTASALANVLWAGDIPQVVRKPVVQVSVMAADGSTTDEVDNLRDTLITALTSFRSVNVASNSSEVSKSINAGRRYRLQIKHYARGEDRKVWWQLVDDGELVLKSGVEFPNGSGGSLNAMREEVGGRLAFRIASVRGIINTIEIAQDLEDTLGNKCVLRAESALDQGGLERLDASRNCLEQTLARTRDDADATALLSRVLLAGKNAAQNPDVRIRALALAKSAVFLAPGSDRALIALMAAQFADGNLDAAIMAGYRAAALNPYNSDSRGKLAFILYLADRRPEGVALAQEAAKAVPEDPPSEALLVLALDAYRSGRFSDASLFAERITGTDFLVAMLRTAALGQLNSPAAHDRVSQLAGNHSEFAAGFRNGLSWWRQEQGILNDLQAGLIKASGNAQP